MKKLRTFLYIAIAILAMLSALCLVACSSGADGKDGSDGTNGKSAYEIWLDNGYSGTQADFLDWLKGADGKDGQNGRDGVDGQDGVKGDPGEKGDKGDTGEKGEKGDKGENGSDGQNGRDGADGQDGVKGDAGSKGEDGEKGDKGDDGTNGLSAYEIFLKYNADYTGSEEQWINGLIGNHLYRCTITFISEVNEDITKKVFYGFSLSDIPEVPEKEGQAEANWDIDDFTNITADMTVNAVYVMQTRTVVFHNEFTDDEDVEITVDYGTPITNVPTVTEKAYNDGYWDVSDFDCIKDDMTVNAVYATQGLKYVLSRHNNDNTPYYYVTKGDMNPAAEELYILAEYEGLSVESIWSWSFTDSGSLRRVWIPNSVTSIGDLAFYGCSNLTSVNC